jgi:MtN3 and saliva related transmembrane protein
MMNLGLILRSWLQSSVEGIGFWAAVLTTLSFAPQFMEARRTGGQGLSWLMLAMFGTGVGLWFLYGLLKVSGPLILANGLTGLQVLLILAVKLRHARRVKSASRVRVQG